MRFCKKTCKIAFFLHFSLLTANIWQFEALLLQRQTKKQGKIMQMELNFDQVTIEDCFRNFVSLVVWTNILMG